MRPATRWIDQSLIVRDRPLPSYAVLMPLAPWESPEILRDALVSLAHQTWPASQVVISCDGPPPPLLKAELLNALLPIEIIIGPGGEGVGPVLARGLIQCSYDMVVRADADDISLPERCALQVSWMARHPEVKILGGVINEYVENRDQPVAQRLVPIGSERISRNSRFRNPLNHPSVIMRRRIVMGVGSYRSRPGFEDYDLWLRILAAHGSSALANIPKVLVLARVGQAHLARRHGIYYALMEQRFFLACAYDRLLPWTSVVIALLVRLPLRLLPSLILYRVMQRATRRKPA